MKKFLFAALIAVSVATSAFAADSKVNDVVLQNFGNMFSKASEVTWTSTAIYVKASFVLNNERMEAFYHTDGDLIGLSKAATVDQLSPKAKAAFEAKYADYTVSEAIKFEGPDETAYFISVENAQEKVIVKVLDNSLIVYSRSRK